jgi:hypothetical protein
VAKSGRVGIIIDSPIAEKKAKPMIIVMDKGYALKPGEELPTPPQAAPAVGAGGGVLPCGNAT